MITSQYPIWLAEFADVIDKRVLWDLIKYRIRQVTIRYSKSKSKKCKARLAEAEEKVKNCEMKYTASLSEDTSAELEGSKQEYESLYENIIQGKIIRSKATWYEKDEKNSKFFLNLESNRSGKTCVRRLFDSQGKIMVNSHLILDELRSFYQNLYRNQDYQDIDDIYADFFNNTTLPKVMEDTKLLCEGVLSTQKCYNALQTFSNGKSPGNNGLTAEFYKTFWDLLGQQLTDSLNYSYLHGELSNTQKQAIIKLIEKKERDRRYIKNWRPISLLNVDVKIASRAIALRLEKILPDIISTDQYAYIKGRTIFDAARTIDDIMEYTKLTKTSGIMTAFDFEKAFDSISWTFLIKTLESFGFGESFINWVKALYTNISSCVLNNGYSTQLFEVQRGLDRETHCLHTFLF